MPDDDPCAYSERLGLFGPRTLRIRPDERRLVDELTERVLATHPAWPWPLIEEEARRQAEAILAEEFGADAKAGR
jgi:hypothetical protein